MRHAEPLRSALERLRSGRATRADTSEVVRHLLAGCGDCAGTLSQVVSVAKEEREASGGLVETDPGVADYDYSSVFSRVEQVIGRHQVALAEEEASVAGLLSELERHPWPRREVLVGNSARFHNWPLVENLLHRARSLCLTDPSEGDRLARLAIRICCLLDPARYGSGRVQDLTARAWGELGNLLRVQERYRASEFAFQRAQEELRSGTGDPVEKANLLSLEAAVLRDRRLFDRAMSLLDRVISIARKLGERGIQREALIRQANCEVDRGRPEIALPLLLQAQGLLDSASEPRLHYVVQHNILWALIKAERFDEAAAGLQDTRELCDRLNYPVDRMKLEYLEGGILHGLGQLGDAERCFRSSLDGMLAEGLHYDAALVGLDLAALLSEQNRHTEVRELAAAMLPVFTSHRIHREAIAALLVFQEAVQREQLSEKLVEELSAYLRNAASNPQLRFKPPSWLSSSKS